MRFAWGVEIVAYPQVPFDKQRSPSAHCMAPHWHVPFMLQVPVDPPLQSASSSQRHCGACGGVPPHTKPVGHVRPHAPQFAASVYGSTQPAGFWQHSIDAPQDAPPLHAHVPPAQFSPIPHCVPLHEHLFAEQLPPLPHVPLVVHPHCFCINAPALQTRLPLQSFPQPPQLKPFVCTFNSQPSSLVPGMGIVQFAKPKSHVDVHVVPVQFLDAVFVPEHTRPHAPQLNTSSTVAVSHPSSIMGAAGFVQSPNPSRHVGVHAPSVHAVLTEFAPEQRCPHVPQFAVEVSKLTSQPSVGSPLQSAKFCEQLRPHMPFVQVAIELGPLGQAFPQAPQFITVVVFTSQPLPGVMSQSAHPMSHESTAHIPMTHASVAFAKLHALLQNAQFCVVPSSVSQPSATSPLQFAVPAPQGLSLQSPFRHAWNALHVVPHAPQLFGSLDKIASQPLAASMSQLAKPELHWPTLHAPA